MSIPMSPRIPKGYEQFAMPTRGGQSAQIYSQLAGGLQGGLPDVLQKLLGMSKGDAGTFEAMEAPALRQFQEQIAPSIANRYAGSGIAGSSGMQNSLTAAGRNLAEDLQAQRSALMERSMERVLGLGNMLLQRPDMETGLVRKQPAWWQQMLGIGAPIAGAAAGGLLGGGAASGLLGLQGGLAAGQGFLY